MKDNLLEGMSWLETLCSGQMLPNLAREDKEDDISDEMVDVMLNTKELNLKWFDKLIFEKLIAYGDELLYR